MFKKDEPGDSPLTLTPRASEEPAIVSGVAVAELTLEAEVKAGGPKTLQEMLHASEPWNSAVPDSTHLSPGVRRLQERRINRILGVVINWLTDLAEQRTEYDAAPILLLELAETVRQQIDWPELRKHEAVVAMIQEARELKQE
jgi:hypothetical protein